MKTLRYHLKNNLLMIKPDKHMVDCTMECQPAMEVKYCYARINLETLSK